MPGRIDSAVDRWSKHIGTKESGRVPIDCVRSEAKPPQQQQQLEDEEEEEDEEEKSFYLNRTRLLFNVNKLIITTVATGTKTITIQVSKHDV